MPRTTKVPVKKWAVPLSHPSYSIERCPRCEFPEADGGYCPACGWLRYDPTCPCKDHKRMRELAANA